jgi:hypothetical protein
VYLIVQNRQRYGNTAMLKSLKTLLGKTHPAHTAKKAAVVAKPKTSNADGDFRAVSLVSSKGSCAAARNSAGKRYLLREVPRLPLANCTMPANCSCKFRKDADRRDGDRRLFGGTETNRWFAGSEGRKRGNRRSTKN